MYSNLQVCKVRGYLVAQAGQPLHCIIDAALGAAYLAAVAHACDGLLPAQHIHTYLGVILQDAQHCLWHTHSKAQWLVTSCKPWARS